MATNTDLLTITIRRKLDKNEKVGTNEIRALLATIAALKERLAEQDRTIDDLTRQILTEAQS